MKTLLEKLDATVVWLSFILIFFAMLVFLSALMLPNDSVTAATFAGGLGTIMGAIAMRIKPENHPPLAPGSDSISSTVSTVIEKGPVAKAEDPGK